MRRVLRVVPHHGDDSVSPIEVAQRLDMSPMAVEQLLARAVRRGLCVRLRKSAYQLPPPKEARQEGA
jgi:hypothetical protein